MKTSESIQEIAKSLALAQAEIKPATKDGQNPHFKSKFSTLTSVWESIKQPMSSHGLVILQDIKTEEKNVSITTTIIHTSGQWIEFGPLSIPLIKNDAQSIGSASSYGKRYSLSAALGIVSSDEDDDGEIAVGRTTYQGNGQKVLIDRSATNNTIQNFDVINDQQFKEIEELWKTTDLQFRKNFTEYMLTNWKIKDLRCFPSSQYDMIITAMKRNIEKQQLLKTSQGVV